MPKVREITTRNPITLPEGTTVQEAARRMKESDIGDVVITNGAGPCGIVTDRDIVLRVIAESKDPQRTKLGDVCTKNLVTLKPEDDIDHAVDLMRQKVIRRLPVAENGQAVGIVSLGDLARARDPRSVLGEASQAPAQH